MYAVYVYNRKVTTSQETIPIAMLYWGVSATEPLIPPAVVVNPFPPHLCTGHVLAAMLHFLAPIGADWKILFMQPMQLENYHSQSE